MKKKDIVENLAKTFLISEKLANLIVNAFFESIKESLKNGEEVQLRGLGAFKIRERKERMGRNPKTGEKVKVPSKKIVYFKQGKEIHNRLKRL